MRGFILVTVLGLGAGPVGVHGQSPPPEGACAPDAPGACSVLELQLAHFVEDGLEVLLRELAIGEGERVDALFRLAGCDREGTVQAYGRVREGLGGLLESAEFGEGSRRDRALLVLELVRSATAPVPQCAPPRERGLSEHREWRALLHMDGGSARSAIVGGDFFLAPSGGRDPLAELRATREALAREPDPSGQAEHAQCRFPGRALWLVEQGAYAWREGLGCARWDAWEARHGESRVELAFATGYLGDPSSIFGHLMFQLAHLRDPARAEVELLEDAFNFGADVPPGDGGVRYMLRGLLGGYEAEFTRTLLYRNANAYSEREMRDLWLYPLELPERGRRLLIAHLFEVEGARFAYRFLSENCASRIARTLEIVLAADLPGPGRPWVSPEAVLRALNGVEAEGQQVLGEPRYRPSRQRRTETAFAALSGEARGAARALWPGTARVDPEAPRYLGLPALDRARVVEIALGHLQAAGQGGEVVERELLLERLRLPVGGSEVDVRAPVPIERAPPALRVTLSALDHSDWGRGAGVSVRLMQHDLLEAGAGRQADAAMEFLHLNLDTFGGDVRLASLELFDLFSLPAPSVRLPGAITRAWRVGGGLRRAESGCRECLDWEVSGQGGRSLRMAGQTAYVLVGPALRSTRHQDGMLAGMLEAGVVSRWSRVSSILAVRHAEGGRGEAGRSTRAWSEQRLALGARGELRIRADADPAGRVWQLRGGLSRYF